jgi:hypothetical protein
MIEHRALLFVPIIEASSPNIPCEPTLALGECFSQLATAQFAWGLVVERVQPCERFLRGSFPSLQFSCSDRHRIGDHRHRVAGVFSKQRPQLREQSLARDV